MRFWAIVFLFHPIAGICQQTDQEYLENNYDNFKELEADNPLPEDPLLYPIDLNRATKEDLKQIGVLTDEEIEAIINYRIENGKFISIYELQALRILDVKQLHLLAPHIYVNHDSETRKSTGYVIMRMDQLTEKKTGFIKGNYLGSPHRIITRARINGGLFQGGLTMEKDSGEPMGFKHYATGVDHMTGYVRYSGKGFVNQAILGDFRTSWGQGLALGNGFGMGKGRETILSLNRIGRSTPYQSLTEFGFFRGALLAVNKNHLHMEAYASLNAVDANLSGKVATLRSSGLTRTNAELQGNESLTLVSIGVQTRVVKQQYQIGMGLLGYRFLSDHDSISRIHKINAMNQHALGTIFYNWKYKNALVFGESAIAFNHSAAVSQGVLVSVSHDVDLSIHYRYFSPRYYSPFAQQSFREGPRTSNERGVYLGIKVTPTTNLTMSAFVDIYRFPQIAHLSGGTSGADLMVNSSLKINETTLKGYFRFKTREVARKDTKGFYARQSKKLSYANLDAVFPITSSISIKLGGWYSIRDGAEKSTGTMVYQDIRWKAKSTQLITRLAMINVPDFENRFYLFEPDVNLAFSVPVYYGQSMKYVLVFKQKMARFLSLQTKFSRTSFLDRDQISTGNESIPGNSKTEIKIQLMAKF